MPIDQSASHQRAFHAAKTAKGTSRTLRITGTRAYIELESFNPKTDRCEIAFDEAGLRYDCFADADGVPELCATFEDGQEMILSFPGCASIPTDRIDILEAPDASQVLRPTPLSRLMAPPEAQTAT